MVSHCRKHDRFYKGEVCRMCHVAALEAEVVASKAACSCNCHDPEARKTMNMAEHANCGECCAAIAKDAAEMDAGLAMNRVAEVEAEAAAMREAMVPAAYLRELEQQIGRLDLSGEWNADSTRAELRCYADAIDKALEAEVKRLWEAKPASCVEETVAQWLTDRGYSGLYADDGECGCTLEDLSPCDGPCDSCRPGYRGPGRHAEETFRIYADKQAALDAKETDDADD